eukprot:3010566-Rhodomonas_salina.1
MVIPGLHPRGSDRITSPYVSPGHPIASASHDACVLVLEGVDNGGASCRVCCATLLLWAVRYQIRDCATTLLLWHLQYRDRLCRYTLARVSPVLRQAMLLRCSAAMSDSGRADGGYALRSRHLAACSGAKRAWFARPFLATRVLRNVRYLHSVCCYLPTCTRCDARYRHSVCPSSGT